jgi:hypothetical protein
LGVTSERTSRLVMLARMDALDADTTRCAFERAFDNIPAPFRKTLTYDRGTEMARHAQLTTNTGIKSLPRRRPGSTSPTPTARGSAAATRMAQAADDAGHHPKAEPASSANICPREPSSADTRRTSSTSSPNGSTIDPARCSTSSHPMRSLLTLLPMLRLLVESVALQLDTSRC